MAKRLKLSLNQSLKQKVNYMKQFGYDNLSSEEFLEVFLNTSIEKVYQNSLVRDPNIKVMAQKVDNQKSLSYAEIRYLLELVHQAYHEATIKYVKAEYVLDCYHALICILQTMDSVSESVRHHLSNLCPYHYNYDNWVDSLKAIQDEFLSEGLVLRVQGARVSQCLHALTTDKVFQTLNIFNLNQKLAPLYQTLITVAKYQLTLEEGDHQLHATNLKSLYDGILMPGDVENNQIVTKNISSDYFHLSIAYQLSPVGLLSLKKGDESYAALHLTGGLYFELINIFRQYSKGVFPIRDNRLSLVKLSDGSFSLEIDKTKLYLSIECANALSEILNEHYQAREPYFLAVAYQLGAI